MHLTIVHYHLNRGGVTQVIANHLRAICAQEDHDIESVTILFGGRAEGWPTDEIERLPIDVAMQVVPELEYDEAGAIAQPQRLTDAIAAQLSTHDPAQSVIHIHNHSLGKNVSMPSASRMLAERGYAVLLQIHDFAEDSRPVNYLQLLQATSGGDREQLGTTLYPQAPNIHYAALNNRDLQLLQRAGIRQSAVHWLPNPINEFPEFPNSSAARERLANALNVPLDHRYILYPVRGIRRKNLGELALYAALADERTHFGLTLAPRNPAEIPNYEHWMGLSKRLDLRCHWDAGGDNGLSFLENLAAADAIISTSVAEGFGMVFLEAWLAGRPLIGRDLPEISAGFVDGGIDFADLSPSLNIPVAWLGGEASGAIESLYRGMAEDYGLEVDIFEIGDQMRRSIGYQSVDFARLTREYQSSVVTHVAESEVARNEVFALNSWLRRSLDADVDNRRELIVANTNAVRKNYSLDAIGERLLSLYKALTQLSDGATYAPADGQKILDAFLDLDRFQPLRIEP